MTTLASVERAGFEASHAYAAAGDYTVTVTVTDDDGGTDSASFAVKVLDLDDAVSDAAADLALLADGASGRQATALHSAATDLIGNNGGTAGNGALSALASGDTVVAVSRILDAEKALATVTTVDVTGPQSLLAGVARVLTEQLVAQAKNATGCAPTTATSCSKGERKSFTTIDAAVAAGHARYAVADWVGAATGYLKAVKAADTLT